MANYGEQNPYYGGGGGGGGGGGFMNSPGGSQDTPGGKKKHASTIRPVTVKQVIAASQVHPDSDFSIDGQDIGVLLLVGTVHNMSTTATNVTYEIGDGTGYIDVRQWLDSADDEAGKMTGIEQDKYVAIMGSIKVFGGKRHLSATHIRAITDHDEVHHHLLKALYVSWSLRNPGGGGGGGGGVGGGAVPQNGARAQNDYSAPVSNGPDATSYAQLPPLQRRIMELVVKEDSEEGLHVSMVSRHVSAGNGEDVMEAIEHLMNEGMLFSTVDDLHIKAV